jgi:hypothetical protein
MTRQAVEAPDVEPQKDLYERDYYTWAIGQSA